MPPPCRTATPAWHSLWLYRGFEPRPVPGSAMISIWGVRGFLIPGDIDWLTRFASRIPNGGVHVEIGSWMGLSSIICANALIANLNFDATIYCVDTWHGSEEHQEVAEVQEDRLFHEFLTNVREAEVERFIRPLRGASVELATTFPDGSVDSVFLDGDHSFAGCTADLNAWLPKVKPGGRIVGHDATPGGGVRLAIEEFANERGFEVAEIVAPPHAHYIWELRRPEMANRAPAR